MAIDLAPETVVPAPPRTGQTQGLLQSVPVVEPDNDRWLGGLRWAPRACGSGAALRLNDSQQKTAQDRPAFGSFKPFLAYFLDQCSTYGLPTAEYEERAVEGLALGNDWQIEFEFWTGTQVTTNPRLASASAMTLGGGAAIGRVEALGLLVDSIAAAGIGRGVIHATTRTALLWSRASLLIQDGPGGVLHTKTGQLVVAGDGYPGTKPDGTAPATGQAWAYATDEVEVYRQPRNRWTVLGGPNQQGLAIAHNSGTNNEDITNKIITVAELGAGIVWNGCLHTAVLVDLTQD